MVLKLMVAVLVEEEWAALIRCAATEVPIQIGQFRKLNIGDPLSRMQ